MILLPNYSHYPTLVQLVLSEAVFLAPNTVKYTRQPLIFDGPKGYILRLMCRTLLFRQVTKAFSRESFIESIYISPGRRPRLRRGRKWSDRVINHLTPETPESNSDLNKRSKGLPATRSHLTFLYMMSRERDVPNEEYTVLTVW